MAYSRSIAVRISPPLMVISLVACGGASEASGPAAPTDSHAVSTIVYMVGDSSGSRLVLTNLDGSSTRAVPCPETNCLDGEISPDGKQLLITGADASGLVRRQYIVGADGSNPRLVATNPVAPMLPTWRHDGKAFYSYRSNGSVNGTSRAYVTLIATGESEPIEPTAFHSGLPTESPDGKQLVFASNRRTDTIDELYTLDLTSSATAPVRMATAGPLAFSLSNNQPRFSPSGSEIAFTYTPPPGNTFDIWIMSATGTNPRPFANSPMRESEPDWSPDGQFIVYLRSPALSVNEIVIARVSDGGIVRTIPEPAGGTVNNPRWGTLR